MKEIEAKFLNINKKALESKLKKLGAKKIFERRLDVHYFDYLNRGLRKNNSIIRLRKMDGKVEFTIKKISAKKNIKVAEELNINVSDFNETIKLLKALGLKEFLGCQKIRTRYMIGKVHFEFDKYLGKYSYIPEFLEIEGPVKAIKEYQELLNLKNPKPYSFHDLIKIYKK